MNWKLLYTKTTKKEEEIIKIILENRKLKTKKEIADFISPPNPQTIKPKDLKINSTDLKKAVIRIKQAIKLKELIIVYGDYDADGICATAIVWEALYKLGANVLPYIPSRTEEGYGLSEKGINNVIQHLTFNSKQRLLIITVDQGIVANKQVEYAKKKGFDVIITDHHVKPKTLPKALAIIHSTALSGSGVAWFLAKSILSQFPSSPVSQSSTSYLDLAAIGSISDLIPLTGFNRSIVKHGLDQLNKTKRIGLLELIQNGGLTPGNLGNYEVGFILAPRLNAMGRLEHAMDSLRLLCTNKKERASLLAKTLGLKNRERQELTEETRRHAKAMFQPKADRPLAENVIFIAHESYNQGVIGLVAGKLSEEFYRPAVILAKGKEISKGSCRSINGFNIIEALRECQELLIDCGGHPMAAGFTVENKNLEKLRLKLEKITKKLLPAEKLEKELKIDCELQLNQISNNLHRKIQNLQPFGIGNPEPVFLSKDIRVTDFRLVGSKKNHVKFRFDDLKTAEKENLRGSLISHFDGIGFNLVEFVKKIKIGEAVDLIYTIDIDQWNGNSKLQLKVKDLK